MRENQYEPWTGENLNYRMVNNWFLCRDAYKDLCACFEHGSFYIELRIGPTKKGYGIVILYGDSLNNINRRKTIFTSDSKEKVEEKFYFFVESFDPDYYLSKYLSRYL